MSKIVNTLKVGQIIKTTIRKNVLFHLMKEVQFKDVEENDEQIIGADTFGDLLGAESENPLAFSPMLDEEDIKQLSELDDETVEFSYIMFI